jgi:DNA-binding winged helix-turn-helix (wHTH) protein
VIYVFGDCELDLGRYELRRAGAVQPVEPQVFDVLALLVREREAGRSQGGAARRRTQRLIRTVHGRGYQFVGQVQESMPPAAAVPSPPPQQIRFCTTSDGV